MEISFKGSLDELEQFAAMICHKEIERELKVMVAEDLDSEKPQNSIDSVNVGELNKDTVPEGTPDESNIDPIAKKPWIDPSTGTYFTAFKDMADALDDLVKNGQQSDVQAILKINSVNGEYCGIPPKAWGNVKNNAITLLKKKSKGAKSKSESVPEVAAEDDFSEEPRLTLPKLRELAAMAKHEGVKVGSILKEVTGLTKLSEIDKSYYNELEDRLHAARKALVQSEE